MPPLSQQVTYGDCVPTTFVNALRVLFLRSDLRGALVKGIWQRALDMGSRGSATSSEAIKAITEWINTFGVGLHHPFRAERCVGRDVTLPLIERCIRNDDGVVALQLNDNYGRDRFHWVLVARIDATHLWVFDPLPTSRNARARGRAVEDDRANLLIPRGHVRRRDWDPYMMGPTNDRECVCLSRR